MELEEKYRHMLMPREKFLLRIARVRVLTSIWNIIWNLLSDSKIISVGEVDTDAVSFGGSRIITFMLYMSSVEAGGHTVFPQPGIR